MAAPATSPNTAAVPNAAVPGGSTLSTQRFPGQAEHVSAARRWALERLPADCPRRADVELVLSELVTNAVLHSASGAPGGLVEVRIEVEADAVALTVVDQGATLTPALRGPGEYGRGLAIVTDLADAYEVTGSATSRCTWCRLDWSPVPAQTRSEY
ncbi:ATP-binding protein [Herbidospora sp. NEAU-GS84]|uniref:ATP-binding protein n=1 Tax=Herbidospora solisilvae TaxID=2696284 RepID=A0A7C9J8L9_9ACTN|nr:ATP-binding protein [Herbidospora solisilvae]NAS27466.1 ATP-binding protein [Herbidospora solisilvae]